MTRSKKALGMSAGIALLVGLVVSVPVAAHADSGWAGAYIDGNHCQADRRLFMQEGYNVSPCIHRSGLPGQWFWYSK